MIGLVILTLVENLYLFFAPAIANKFPGFQRKQHLHSVCHFIFVNLLWITIPPTHSEDQSPSSKRKGTTRLQWHMAVANLTNHNQEDQQLFKKNATTWYLRQRAKYQSIWSKSSKIPSGKPLPNMAEAAVCNKAVARAAGKAVTLRVK